MLRRFAFAFFVVTIAFATARTNAQLGKVTPNQVVITAAVIEDGFVRVAGMNFGAAPSVFMGGVPLAGVAVNPLGTALVALDPGFPPGTYLLHVSTGNGQVQNGTFNVSVGGAGPIGPKGNDGTNGIDGKDGRDGVDGRDGATGATGATGPAGPQGPVGPAGPPLASLNAIAGVPCTVGDATGAVSVTTAANGDINLRCVIPTLPVDPNAGFDAPLETVEKYFSRFLQFEIPGHVSSPFPRNCFGDPSGVFGTGGCIGPSAAGLSIDTATVNFSFAPESATPIGQLGHFDVQWQFTLSGLLPMQYQMLGIPGSCNVSVNGPQMRANLRFEFDRMTDPSQDIIRLESIETLPDAINLGNCGVLGDFSAFADFVMESVRAQAAQAVIGSLGATRVCRARGTDVFEACPAP